MGERVWIVVLLDVRSGGGTTTSRRARRLIPGSGLLSWGLWDLLYKDVVSAESLVAIRSY